MPGRVNDCVRQSVFWCESLWRSEVGKRPARRDRSEFELVGLPRLLFTTRAAYPCGSCGLSVISWSKVCRIARCSLAVVSFRVSLLKHAPRRREGEEKELTLPTSRGSSSVIMADEGYACRFCVDGIEVGRSILSHLSRSFAFQTSEPIRPGPLASQLIFRVAYGSQMDLRSLVQLVSRIPGLRLQVMPAVIKENTHPQIRRS
ncbi:hypothetical protein Pan181_42310 [Aeoliella mucimassa]|uniref:Uncharacterized protein n=1 Tax=Aeoliella mucimassa TaxID=2527972 RepID=A0A518ATH2_9BACT|nr:hypothetical protein Pan181_42310 [Aeoliella mucimassa]